MTILGRVFRPPWWSIMLTGFGVAVFVSLGLWQLQRAELKNGIMDLYQQRLSEDYQRLTPSGLMDADVKYRKVELKGRFDVSRQLLLDNRIHNGRAGYHVLTPFLLEGEQQAVLINRGWVTLGESRARLPELEVPVDSDVIRGIVSIPDASGFQLGEVALTDQWPQVIPYIDMTTLRSQYPLQLVPVIIWMAPEISGHYVRHWVPVWSDPEKSRAYAVQWFSFAAIALFLFFVLNVRKPDE